MYKTFRELCWMMLQLCETSSALTSVRICKYVSLYLLQCTIFVVAIACWMHVFPSLSLPLYFLFIFFLPADLFRYYSTANASILNTPEIIHRVILSPLPSPRTKLLVLLFRTSQLSLIFYHHSKPPKENTISIR